MKHLVFFDDTCGLCLNAVLWILKHDIDKQFLFAPLSGKTAQKILTDHFERNTLVLVESSNHKRWFRGKAVFRILSLLGGKWKYVGWISGLPFVNAIYRLVAFSRSWVSKIPAPSAFDNFRDRFLD